MFDQQDRDTVVPEDVPEAPATDYPETGEAPDGSLATAPKAEQAAAHDIQELVRREPRATTGTSRSGLHVTLAGILLVVLGVILIWPVFSGGYILVPGIIAVIAAVGLALCLLAYWLHSGREARGALFLALTCLLWTGLSAVFFAGGALDTRHWPLYVAALGLAILLTFAGDRRREARLATPGLILLAGGVIALLVTSGVVPSSVLAAAAQSWPWVLVALILILLPLAFRRVPRRRQ